MAFSARSSGRSIRGRGREPHQAETEGQDWLGHLVRLRRLLVTRLNGMLILGRRRLPWTAARGALGAFYTPETEPIRGFFNLLSCLFMLMYGPVMKRELGAKWDAD